MNDWQQRSRLGVVPARGGSSGVPHKNLQPVNGRPLVLHAADALAAVCDTVVISTDHPHIESVARLHGYPVSTTFRHSDGTNVGDVARHVAAELDWSGDVVVLQPTCPFVDVEWFLQGCATEPGLSAVGGVDVYHQHWHDADPILSHVSRQQRQHDGDALMREVGVYYWPAGWVGAAPDHIVDCGDGTDIDTPTDLRVAQLTDTKRVLFLYASGDEIGSGHQRRVAALAHAMPWHDVDVRPDRHESTAPLHDADLIVTDWLDTPADTLVKSARRWVTFEDLGPGARFADAVVNALYQHSGVPGVRQYVGPEWSILRPEFINPPPYEVRDGSRVLVMFGGTDPAGMVAKVRDSLEPYGIDATYIEQGANIPVAATMAEHDLLVTSAGRTVYEAAAIGIPTYVLPVNQREATHVHLGAAYGNHADGLGPLTSPSRIRNTVCALLGSPGVRRDMSLRARAAMDGRGLERCVWLLESLLAGMPL